MALSSSSLSWPSASSRVALSPTGDLYLWLVLRNWQTFMFKISAFLFSLSIALFVLSISLSVWGLGCILHCKPERRFRSKMWAVSMFGEIISSSLELPPASLYLASHHQLVPLSSLFFSSQKASVFAKFGTFPSWYMALAKGQRDRRDSWS